MMLAVLRLSVKISQSKNYGLQKAWCYQAGDHILTWLSL